MSTLLAALLAGVLSVLSPCVLPIVPIVVAAASSAHRYGALALAAGLAFSFTAVGLFVASIGFALGIDSELVRALGGVMMIAIGGLLTLPSLQAQFAEAAGPASNWLNTRFSSFTPSGLPGQFGVGTLMGVVWSPCVGPTLGAAIVLASTGENLTKAAFTMLAFGVGAALPMLLIAFLWRAASQHRGQMIAIGGRAKQVMGVLFILVGAMILAGLDKRVEAMLVEASPQWLTKLTTAF